MKEQLRVHPLQTRPDVRSPQRQMTALRHGIDSGLIRWTR